jgi:hypothetical protein
LGKRERKNDIYNASLRGDGDFEFGERAQSLFMGFVYGPHFSAGLVSKRLMPGQAGRGACQGNGATMAARRRGRGKFWARGSIFKDRNEKHINIS